MEETAPTQWVRVEPDGLSEGRVTIAPPEAELARAVALLGAAERPVIICGNGARPFRHAVIAVDVGNGSSSAGAARRAHVRVSRLDRLRPPRRPGRLGGRGPGGQPTQVISISGDGGLGQYLADLTTAVKYALPLTHVVLNDGELAKISREQLAAIRPVWETGLVNPDFCEYARLCGAKGWSVRRPDELRPALEAALATMDGPTLVEIHSSSKDV